MLDYEIDQREKGVAEMPEDDELNNCWKFLDGE